MVRHKVNVRRRASAPLAAMLFVLLSPLLCGIQSQGEEIRKAAPDFQLADLAGITHRLADLHGKVVVLNFWASWCPECLAEIDALSALTEKYRSKGVVVLSISLDKNEQALRAFLEAHPVKFPVMLDREGDMFVRKYAVRGLPATIIIDRQGTIAARMLGAQEFISRDFTGRIDGLLEK